jgi:hypothetical protein
LSFADEYRGALESAGKTWADDVVTETGEGDFHPEKTWLRHVPTGVIIHHHGRSHAGTLHHLGEILHSHGMITLDERDAAVTAAGRGDG